MPALSQAQDLRNRLLIRIALAVCALVIGLLVLSWMGDPGPIHLPDQPHAAAPAPPAAQPTLPAAATPGDGGSSGTGVTGAGAQDAKPDSTVPQPAPVSASSDDPAANRQPQFEAMESESASDKPAAAAAAATKDKLPRGPHLQAGAFAHAANAEALKAQLEAEGLPVYVESRVQIGPFKSRKEAERMREKLRAMGVKTVLIVQ